MKFKAFRTLLVGSALLLPACSFIDNTLWPALTGDDPPGANTQTAQTPPAAGQQATAQQTAAQQATSAQVAAPQPVTAAQPVATASPQPQLGTGNFEPTGVTAGAPTGTFVGKQVVELREELQRLQGNITTQNGALQELRAQLVSDSQRYHGTIAAVNARLQVGTTPGNPILVQQFKSAQSDLERLAQDVASMTTLQNSIANSATMATFLHESANASFTVSGAIDEDHRQLAILEDEVSQTDVLIDRLFKEVTNDVQRQTNYVSTERANLNLMSAGIQVGEIYGGSLLNVAMAGTAPVMQISAGDPLSTTGRRPLMVVRFDRDDVPYQQALYNAVSRVLERRPDAVFDLVAVAPSSGGQARVALNSSKARRHAENVLRSLIEMGLPPVRVAVSAKTAATAQANEVHLYLR